MLHGKEITVNNLGQNFANFVDNDDNLEYVNNILMDKNTGLEAVGTQAQEAFFNTGEGSQVAIRAADAEAAGVDLSYANGAPVYTVTSTNSGKDYTFSTLAGANEMKTNILNEANRVFAINNDIESLFLSGNNPRSYYLDDSGTRYDTPQEALAANELLAAQVPVETTNSVVAQDFGQVYDASGNRIDAGALPTGSNSVRETIANLITPFDSAYYEDGTLYGYDKDGNVIDLTGGGESYNSLTGTSNYVYGVSDDADTGTALDTIGMSDDEVSTAQVSDELLRDIPPDDLAYFATFFGNNVLPVFGGTLAGMMLDAGIEERRAYMDTEIAALEAGATPTYNAAGEYTGHDTGATDQYNLNYDPTGGDTITATGALPGATTTTTADAAEEAANSMTDAGILSLGGKQMPDDPDIVGNTPILEYSDGGYTVVGGLTEGEDPSLSYNADGTLHIPYDGKDPHTISADTAFYGSTDPNAEDYNMSKDLAENGSYVNLAGETVTDDAFATDLTQNGAAVANVVGQNVLLTTGDDSKMVVSVEGGGYQLVDGTPLTNKVLENIITEGVNDGTLSADLLDTYGLEGGAEAAAAIDTTDGDPAVSKIYDRFFRSGSSAGLPAYMARWIDGIDFNERLEKVMVDGQVVYINSKGETIPAEYLESTLRIDEDGNIIETED